MKYYRLGFLAFFALICQNVFADNLSDSCDTGKGLSLLNQEPVPIEEVQEIVSICEKNKVTTFSFYFLKGLLARKIELPQHNFKDAIENLQKAVDLAEPNNNSPSLELAVTYEWNNQLDQAKEIYQNLLKKDANLLPAQLGLARIATSENKRPEAIAIYQTILESNPNNIDALTHLAQFEIENNDYVAAKKKIDQVLKIQQENQATETNNTQKTENQVAEQNQLNTNQPNTQINNEEQNNQATIQENEQHQTNESNNIPNTQINDQNQIDNQTSCEVNTGLQLVNENKPPLSEIKSILAVCDQKIPDDSQVLLLHGLLARKQGMAKHHYQEAIMWLKKASEKASKDNHIPDLELATTYYWNNSLYKAKTIYEKILSEDPHSREALLGLASVLIAQNNLSPAENIYQQLLMVNKKDIDALNGLGRIELIRKNYAKARSFYLDALEIDTQNTDSTVGLEQTKKAEMQAKTHKQQPSKTPSSLCDVNQGLDFINQKNPPYNAIDRVLEKCDEFSPNSPEVLLLHGLVSRKKAIPSGNFTDAIEWLKKAAAQSPPDNDNAALELATTYEWNQQPEQAKKIYQSMLLKNPHSIPAWLGLARVDQQQYDIKNSKNIYYWILKNNPTNVEAINGLGSTELTNYELDHARQHFNEALALDPNNQDSISNLQLLNNVYKYMLSISGGSYSIGDQTSYNGNINFYDYINATDQIIVQYTHNTSQLPVDILVNPTLLPNNDFLLGYQHQISNTYGWGTAYEVRQRTNFNAENRLWLSGNIYLTKNLQWLGGVIKGYPDPWNDELYFVSANIITNLPVNFTWTLYYGEAEFGGSSKAYALDLNKEFANRSFYDIGMAYSPNDKAWDLHGSVILMVTKNQGVEFGYEHYTFNDTNVADLGWRIYW